MFLGYAILLLILIALLLRRDLTAIGRLSFKGGVWFILLVIGLFLLQLVILVYVPGKTTWQTALLIASQAALVGMALLNAHIPGAKLFALGLALNLVVMAANGGWMPVTPQTNLYVHPDAQDELYSRPTGTKNVILPRDETRFWLLSDIIRFPLPRQRMAMSLGDAILILAAAQLIFQTTAPVSNKKQDEA